jgi:ELWxxDGT repeat protein
MKKKVLITAWVAIVVITAQSQVTQINSNKSLQITFPLSNTKAIAVSAIDSSIWVTDGTLAGTFQISPTVKFEGGGGLISGQFIFRGSSVATGSEIYKTDGTVGGTVLVSDIYPGAPGSNPADFSEMNGFIYFSAFTVAAGRELWRTNGTLAGTTLVKDIVPGNASSNQEHQYHIFSNGNYLLFAAGPAATGVELWKSDGTDAGTNLLTDINSGNAGADSSNPNSFYPYNNMVLFTAKNSFNGSEIWRTDGTFAGTFLLKDINPGTAGSTDVEIFPGFSIPLFLGFHIFNNRAYFQASDGVNSGDVWVTNGTSTGTTLVKTIVSGTALSITVLADAVNLPGKFIFPVSDLVGRSELWESDGTPGGTTLFKSFSPIAPDDIPVILIPYFGDFLNGSFGQSLFQGNKFFFTGPTPSQGYELWLSDGTAGGTALVKDIFPGVTSSLESTVPSYVYTTGALYFPANNGVNGQELWKSDGTNGGTTMVADIVTGLLGSDPLLSGFIINGKIIFEADNGDSPTETDLYAVDGTFTPLPVSLADFTVAAVADDAVLNWHTLQELNSKDFTIQRSFDGGHFNDIGTVVALGNSSTRHGYTFTDAGIINSGQSILYYRLLSTDIDGKSAYSNVITLKLKNTPWSVRLLTNPVVGDIRLATKGITGNVRFAINDLSGKSVYKSKLQTANGIVNIPASGLLHGLYVLVITNGAERKSIPFIK